MPPSRDFISDRVARQGRQLFPPFYRLGTIDCYVNEKELEESENISMDDLLDTKRISKYGRPLWWSILKLTNLSRQVIRPVAVRGETKLCGGL